MYDWLHQVGRREKHHRRASSHPPGFEPGASSVPRIHRRGSGRSSRCNGTSLLATGRSSLPDDRASPHLSGGSHGAAIAPGSTPRELKITWNTNAVCNVGVAVADQRGFFAKRNLKVEKDQFCGRDRSVAGAARERQGRCRCRHGAGLDEAAGARLRCEADSGDPWRLHSPDHHPRVRHHQRRGLEGQDRRDGQHGQPGQEFHVDPGGQARHRSGQGYRMASLPADLLGVALQKGEIQAFSGTDPIVSIIRDRDHLVEVTNNLSGRIREPHLLRARHTGQAGARRASGRRRDHRRADGGAGMGGRKPGCGGRDLRGLHQGGDRGAVGRRCCAAIPTITIRWAAT